MWRATHGETKQTYALKVLHGSLADDEVVRQRFVEEGLIQARVAHPHVVAIKGRIEAHPIHALVMEFIDGPTLDETVRERPLGLLLSEIKTVSTGLLSALNAAHRREIVHRDVKPSNVLLAQEIYSVTPKLTDFGIAKFKYGRSRTVTGAPMGTPHFMSPEQLRDSKSVTLLSDIYSFGVSLFYMVTGSYPFDKDDLNALMVNIVSGDHARASTLRTNLPSQVDDLIEHCMAKLPGDRPQSCREVIELILSIDWTDQEDDLTLRRSVTGEAEAVRKRESAELAAVRQRVKSVGEPTDSPVRVTHRRHSSPHARASEPTAEHFSTSAKTVPVTSLHSGAHKAPPPIPLDAVDDEPEWLDPGDFSGIDITDEAEDDDDDLAAAFRTGGRRRMVVLFVLVLICAAGAYLFTRGDDGQTDDPEHAADAVEASADAGVTGTDAIAEGTGHTADAGVVATGSADAGADTADGNVVPSTPDVAQLEVVANNAPDEEPVRATQPETPTRSERDRERDRERQRERERERERQRERERERDRERALAADPTPYDGSLGSQADAALGRTRNTRQASNDDAETTDGGTASGNDSSQTSRPAEPEAPTQLTPLQINSVLRAERSDFRACFDPADGSTVTIRINVRPDGSVGYASATDAESNPTVVRCLVGILSSIEFEEFSGSPMNVRHRFTRAGP